MRFQNLKYVFTGILLVVVIVSGGYVWWISGGERHQEIFDKARAFNDLKKQVEFGPRVPGSAGHQAFLDWAVVEFDKFGWETTVQSLMFQGKPIRNLIAQKSSYKSGEPWIILAAHYDTRPVADHDPVLDNRIMPVPGANDGASGIAVLMELARVLPSDLNKNLWIVFFDYEDSGDITGNEWGMGSQAFVEALLARPDARIPEKVVVIDMIGDMALNIHPERNSDPVITAELFSVAQELGFGDVFLPIPKYSMLDDHTAFISNGIPAALLIDFDYPYWHTVSDTPDKTSPDSLEKVGKTLFTWLTER